MTAVPKNKAMFWAGWIVTGIVGLMLAFSGAMKFSGMEDVQKEFTRLGYTDGAAVTIGIIEVACLVLYLFPRTAVLGAVLLTGYLGGATATHVRIHDPPDKLIPPLIAGALVWLALFLREPRVRAILPWMTSDGPRDVN